MRVRTLKRVDHWLGLSLVALLGPLGLLDRLLGRLLPWRRRGLEVRGRLVVVKILGGGSLLIALPALQALRERYPDVRMTLLCSPGVRPFGEMCGVFDDYAAVSTDSLPRLLRSCLSAYARVFAADTVVNLEIHSKLTGVFCFLTAARNRLGLSLNWNRWQNTLITHSLFYNDSAPIYVAYFQLARALGATIPPMEEVARRFRAHNGLEDCRDAVPADWPRPLVALAPFCSDLTPEREFTPEEWVTVLRPRLAGRTGTVMILGGPADRARSAVLAAVLEAGLPGWRVADLAGRERLAGSARRLAAADELVTIDSGINHIARLLRLPITSYWGPTEPYRRLAPFADGGNETVVYRKIFCAPCVHLMDEAPCLGNNVCMKQYVGPVDQRALDTGWAVHGRPDRAETER